MNGGITFFKTQMLDELTLFYQDTIGCELWLDQGGCRIFRFGNQLFGFCGRDESDLQGLLTFVYETNDGVDAIYAKLAEMDRSNPEAEQPAGSPARVGPRAEPRDNPDYRIYHFYAQDPEGRAIEFQRFWDPMKPVS